MSQKEKLLRRALSKPKDFTYAEAVTLVGYFDFLEDNCGKTSGSRIRFKRADGCYIIIHKPHGGRNYLHTYQLDDVLDGLRKAGVIE